MQPRFPSPSPRAPGSPRKAKQPGVGEWGGRRTSPCTSPPIPSPGRRPLPALGIRDVSSLWVAAKHPLLGNLGDVPGSPLAVSAGWAQRPRPVPALHPGSRAAPGADLPRGAGPGPGRAGARGAGARSRDWAPSAARLRGPRRSRCPGSLCPRRSSLRRRRHCPYSNCTVQPKPRMMLATPFLVSPRARGVLPCLKGAAAAGPPTPSPPPHPASEARTGSAGPLLPRPCPPVGLRPLRREDRAVIRFWQVGGGSSPPRRAPPASDLSAPPRGAVPACQLIWPQSSPGRGGSGPPGCRGWGPPDKQAPSLCAGRGAGGRGLCPRRLGRGRMAAGAGSAVRTARTDAGVGRAARAAGGGSRVSGWGPLGPGACAPQASVCPAGGKNLGAGVAMMARVRRAPGSLNETANLPSRDYIKESPPPAAPGA
jgi:hypothetical protein